MYIKYPLATSHKSGSRPSDGGNSRLKTTTKRSINLLRKFYAVKFSCIHGGRKYKATGKVRKTSNVLSRSEKKKKFVCIFRGKSAPTTHVTNERVFQHDTIFFVQSSAVRGLRLWHILKENCSANVWNLELHICMPCHQGQIFL